MCFCKCDNKLKIPSDELDWNPFSYKTRYTSYVYSFDSKVFRDIDPKSIIDISSFGPNGLKNAYENILKSKKFLRYYYVVCPTYWDSEVMQDTQLAVTGSCLFGEDTDNAVGREIAEELGISVDIGKLKHIHKYINKKGIVYNTFILDASYGRAYDKKHDKLAVGKDDPVEKIQVVVIGRIDKIRQIVESISDRPYSSDSRKIRSLRLLSLSEFI